MSSLLIYAIGFLAQILFTARSVFQWVISEKNKKVLTPTLFWWFSIFGSFLLFVYGYFREDFAIMFGQACTYFIYIRNLQLMGEWKKLPRIVRFLLFLFPVLIVMYYFNNNTYDMDKLLKNEAIPVWLLIWGIFAQILFTLRFVYQWIYSEKIKSSVLPLGFWILSLSGSLLILIYAIFRLDPVLFLGHILGIIIYTRNIFLLKQKI